MCSSIRYEPLFSLRTWWFLPRSLLDILTDKWGIIANPISGATASQLKAKLDSSTNQNSIRRLNCIQRSLGLSGR